MNVTLSTKELSTTLKVLAGAYSRKNTLPILDNVLIEAFQPDSLRLTVHNLEFAPFTLRRTLTGVTVTEEGSTTVNLRDLRNALPGKSSHPVTLTWPGEPHALKVCYGVSTCAIDSLPADEFPPFPTEQDDITSMAFDDLSKLRDALAATLPAVSTDLARPLLTAIHGNKTYLEAADGFRLHRQDVGQSVPDFLINAKLAKALLSSTAEKGWIETKDERLHYADNDGWESSSDMSWYGRNYPELDQVIPRASQHKLTIEQKYTENWLDALDTAYKANESRIVRLALLQNNNRLVELSTKNGAFAAAAPATVKASCPFMIGFNAHFLRDALACAGKTAGQVNMELNVETTPGVITTDYGYKAVIMPMYLYAD